MIVEIRAHRDAPYWKATLSFAEPTCPVCGAPATILSAEFGQDIGTDYWTVRLTCPVDPAHGADRDGDPYVFQRTRYVFVSDAVRREAEQYLVHGHPEGLTAMLVRDIGTGVARVLIDPTNTRFTDDADPTTCVDLATKGMSLAETDLPEAVEEGLSFAEIADALWEHIDYWGDRIWGYDYVIEGRDDRYAALLAESVAAGRGINPDGSVAGVPAPMEDEARPRPGAANDQNEEE